jgi:uncharacterized membrane protein
MIAWLRGASPRTLFALVTFVPLLLLFGLLLFAPPDGNERAQLWQFVGRFHPPSVHLPIALLILVPVLELAGRTRRFPVLLPAVDFLLGVAVATAIAAAFLGWCLARSGSYSGPLMTQHMWGGLLVASVAWACWYVRAQTAPFGQRAYPVLIIAAAAVVSFTGYRGGQLSQGENHLTEFMPESLAGMLGVGVTGDAPSNSPNGGPNTFYGARIQPLFSSHCVSCHGRSKHKSNLRLDSYEATMRGGSHGVVIKAGEAQKSELLRRVTLPHTDDDFMPADKKRPLSPADIKSIEAWISSGASGTLAIDAIKDLPASSTIQPVAEVTFEEIDPDAVAKQRASLAAAIAQFQNRFPNVLDYQSRASADLVVNAAWKGAKFGDADLAALAPLSERIVAADFSNTAITDKSAGAIAAMKHLRSLRLMHTRISDTTLHSLGSLDKLEVLSIFDTAVTPSGLQELLRLPKLRRIYASDKMMSLASSLPADLKSKLVF